MRGNGNTMSNDLSQSDASRQVLAESQKESFPYVVRAFGLDIIVHKGVFSPKYFEGWQTFTDKFPCIRGDDVLEIGCGVGVTAILLAQRGANRVVAVDVNPAAVANTRENAERNGVQIEVRQSDIFSAIEEHERFHTIYWNLPFIWMPPDYRVSSMLERALFDPGYELTTRFLASAHEHLYRGGRLLAGLGDFADLDLFRRIADEHGYEMRQVASGYGMEIHPVEFQLYELREKTAVFYAMPFTAHSLRRDSRSTELCSGGGVSRA